jgi:hypothetical protein
MIKILTAYKMPFKCNVSYAFITLGKKIVDRLGSKAFYARDIIQSQSTNSHGLAFFVVFFCLFFSCSCFFVCFFFFFFFFVI